MNRSEIMRLENELDVALKVVDSLRLIRSLTKHGRIELAVKDGIVVYCNTTVRENL
jgi:hypothetical protein